jgi:hypothetical protein
MLVGRATRERVRIEPTSEVSTFHSMKLGSDSAVCGMLDDSVRFAVYRHDTAGASVRARGRGRFSGGGSASRLPHVAGDMMTLSVVAGGF